MRIFGLALAIFIICFLRNSLAIKCFKCKSWLDRDCTEDTFNKADAIVDCDFQTKPLSNQQYLRVTKCSKVIARDRIGQMVARDCHWEIFGQKDNSCHLSGDRQIVSCNICHNDLCNSFLGSVGNSQWA